MKEYKKLIRYKKHEFRSQLIKKLECLESKNPQEYWNLVKELRKKKNENIITFPNDYSIFLENLYSKKTYNRRRTNGKLCKQHFV